MHFKSSHRRSRKVVVLFGEDRTRDLHGVQNHAESEAPSAAGGCSSQLDL